jgi:hypothetical protein
MFIETNDQVNSYKTKITELKTELLESNVTDFFFFFNDSNLIVYIFNF